MLIKGKGKRQEKDGGPLYGLLKMGKLGTLTREESAREERGRTSLSAVSFEGRVVSIMLYLTTKTTTTTTIRYLQCAMNNAT